VGFGAVEDWARRVLLPFPLKRPLRRVFAWAMVLPAVARGVSSC